MTTVYVDTETSGLHPPSAVVLEVGAVAVRGGKVVDTFSMLVNPGEGVLTSLEAQVALSINKLDPEELRRARPVEYVADQFRAWLLQLGPLTITSYNVDFDSRFLRRAPWSINPMSWGACVMKLVSNGRKYIKLAEAARRFNLTWEGDVHRALPDAMMAFKVDQAYREHNGLVRV